MTNAVIQAQQTAKVFNPASEEQVVALQDITLEVQPEEFISLIGPSGCGKSTLLRLIAGLVAPSEGELLVNNKAPQQARIDRDYGMVFQAPTLLEWRSVRKNIELPLEIQGVPAQERRQKAQAALGARFDLRAFDDTVVLGGNVPLDVLGTNVDEYIRTGG